MVGGRNARIASMYGRDRFAATLLIIVVLAVYGFALWRMVDRFTASGLFWLMAGVAAAVLLLDTAAVVDKS